MKRIQTIVGVFAVLGFICAAQFATEATPPSGISFTPVGRATVPEFNVKRKDKTLDWRIGLDADQPIAVFPGSEASDAPFFDTLASRSCCADHLEEQLTPIRAVGKTYVRPAFFSSGKLESRSQNVTASSLETHSTGKRFVSIPFTFSLPPPVTQK